MYRFIAKVLPYRMRSSYHDMLVYTDVKTDHLKFIGFIISFGIGIALAIALDLMMLFNLSLIYFAIIFAASYVVFEIAIYMWVWLNAASKGSFAEVVLPDALQMMSTNIRAGLTTERALLASARPEFGILEKEIRKAGKQVLTGKEVKYALLEIPGRIKSKLIDRTFRLIVEGVESGGELADLLEQTAEDIQNSRSIQKEVRANVMMYAIFIFFAAGIGAPLIFGISTFLVEVLQTQFSKFVIPEVSTGIANFGANAINISPGFLLLYTLLSLLVTSIFGGLIIGLIKDGEEKQGVKYIPLLLLLSLAVFFAVRSFVGGIFTGMI